MGFHINKCAFCGEDSTRGYPTMGGEFTHLCDACPAGEAGDNSLAHGEMEDGDTSDVFADFIRTAMESFGIDPDAWLEEQERLDRDRAEES